MKRQAAHIQKLGARAVSKPPANSTPRHRKKEIFLPTLLYQSFNLVISGRQLFRVVVQTIVPVANYTKDVDANNATNIQQRQPDCGIEAPRAN